MFKLKDSPTRIVFIIGIIVVILIIIYGLYYKYRIEKTGVITIARIEKFESSEQGGNLFITIFYGGNEYKTIVNAICISCKKKYYYIKIFKDKPTTHPIFYEEKPVPECILTKPLPAEGWKEIPLCSKDE